MDCHTNGCPLFLLFFLFFFRLSLLLWFLTCLVYQLSNHTRSNSVTFCDLILRPLLLLVVIHNSLLFFYGYSWTMSLTIMATRNTFLQSLLSHFSLCSTVRVLWGSWILHSLARPKITGIGALRLFQSIWLLLEIRSNSASHYSPLLQVSVRQLKLSKCECRVSTSEFLRIKYWLPILDISLVDILDGT